MDLHRKMIPMALILSSRRRLEANSTFIRNSVLFRAWDTRKIVSTRTDADSVDFQLQGKSESNLQHFDVRTVLVDLCFLTFLFWNPPDSCFQGKELFAKVPATIMFSEQ